MVRKVIKQILRKKIKNWLESIKDNDLKNLLSKNIIVTGGAIVSMLQNPHIDYNATVKDFDIYFRTKEAALKVAKYYVNIFNEKHGIHENKIGYKHEACVIDGAKDIEDQLEEFNFPVIGVYEKDNFFKYPEGKEKRHWDSHMLTNIDENRVKIIIRSDGVARTDGKKIDEPIEEVYDTEIVGEDQTNIQKNYINVVTDSDNISNNVLEKDDEINYYRPLFLSTNAITLSQKVQLVIRFWGEPEEIHKNYDFIHCTCYWSSWDDNLVLPPAALESIINKQLVYQGSKYPVCSIMRMRKFISRGWTINAGQILKILFQVSELDLKDIEVLEEQLVGVDSMYFLQLVEALKNKMESDKDFNITTDYINTILDKLFG